MGRFSFSCLFLQFGCAALVAESAGCARRDFTKAFSALQYIPAVMKLIQKFIALLLLTPVMPLAAQNVRAYKGHLTFQVNKITKANDSLYVSLKTNLGEFRLRSRAALALTPVIASPDGRQRCALAPTVLGGRNRVIMAKRGQFAALGVKEGTPVARHRNRKDSILVMDYAIPYESWMRRAQLLVEEQTTGCANCDLGRQQYTLVDRLFRSEYAPQYQVLYAQPATNEVKVRADKFIARFNFRVNKYDLLPNLGNNRRELARVDSVARAVLENPDFTVRNVAIDGYASPEGNYQANITLSRNRGQALVNHLVRNYKLRNSLFNVTGHGEDWTGLEEAVAKTVFEEQEKVMEIFVNYPSEGERKEQLKKLGATYKFLIDNVYPSLRRTEYKFVYEVRPYTLEEAKEVILRRPDLLSKSEMMSVAMSYPEGSEARQQALLIAKKIYPNEDIVKFNNLAGQQINRPETVTADQFADLLETPEWNNNIGVFFGRQKEYARALEYFEKAGDNPVAKANAAETRKALEDQ